MLRNDLLFFYLTELFVLVDASGWTRRRTCSAEQGLSNRARARILRRQRTRPRSIRLHTRRRASRGTALIDHSGRTQVASVAWK